MEGQALDPGGLAEDRRPPPTAPEKPPIFDDASSKIARLNMMRHR